MINMKNYLIGAERGKHNERSDIGINLLLDSTDHILDHHICDNVVGRRKRRHRNCDNNSSGCPDRGLVIGIFLPTLGGPF